MLTNYLSVSENLYSSKFRFIYEIIQNADDAYQREDHKTQYAQPENDENDDDTEPVLKSILKRQMLIIESNEPGFTAGDVGAICATGERELKWK